MVINTQEKQNVTQLKDALLKGGNRVKKALNAQTLKAF
jgi:hypothetical protein